MRKKVAKIVTILVLAVVLSGLCLLFLGCEKEDTWEIVFFDDNWNQLENTGLTPNSKSHNWGTHAFIYNGEIKGFNAKAYKNGKEIYKFDYKDSQCYKDNILKISICKRPESIVFEECSSINDMPIEKGEYYIQLMFYDAYKNNKITNLESCVEELKFFIK